MNRIGLASVEQAKPDLKKLFDNIQEHIGSVPNFFRTMGNSAPVLKACRAMQEAAGEISLDPKLQEQIALAVSETNQCNYCLAAHSQVGLMVGLKEQDILQARKGEAQDPKTKAILKFSRLVAENRGKVSNKDIEELKAAKVSEKELVEIIFIINLCVFINNFNLIADPQLDFPSVPKLN